MAIPAFKYKFQGNLLLKHTTLNDFSMNISHRQYIDDY